MTLLENLVPCHYTVPFKSNFSGMRLVHSDTLDAVDLSNGLVHPDLVSVELD